MVETFKRFIFLTAHPFPRYGPNYMLTTGLTWQIILNNSSSSSLSTGTFDPVSVYDIDLFDTPASTISRLHTAGKRVICYFSAGSYEDWRPDASQFPSSSLGNKVDNWPGEKWVDTNSAVVRGIMSKRLDLAVQKKCDAVDPDNIDAYENDNGLGLTTKDAINYVSFLTNESHSRGLACGLKNGGKIVPSVLPMVEFEVNEQCVQYNECSTYSAFISAGKPVFHIEYLNDTTTGIQNFCDAAGEEGFSTVIKNIGLDEFYETC
jgi:hypothetical protein